MKNGGEALVTEVGSHKKGVTVQDYNAFTAHEKDTRRWTAS
jgi:hypothetical protein